MRPIWQIQQQRGQQQRIQQQRRDFQRGQGYIMYRRREMEQQGYHHKSGFGSAIVGGMVGWVFGKLR